MLSVISRIVRSPSSNPTMAKKNRNSDTMAYDVFEREYEDEISWETERLLGEGEYEDDEYDAAFEAAIDAVAAAKGITLV